MRMIFRMSAAPTTRFSVSLTAKSDSGSILLWDGPWVTIRRFLTIHVVRPYEIPTIEAQLHQGVEQAFEIKTSETLLALAGFRSKLS